MANVYGYDLFLSVPLPEGETMIDVRVPRKGDRWLCEHQIVCGEGADGCLPSRDSAYIILAPKKTDEELLYAPWGGVVIPEGYERVDFRVPEKGEYFLMTGNEHKASRLNCPFEFTGGKRTILKKKQTEEESVYDKPVVIPDGYERVGFQSPRKGDLYITSLGETLSCNRSWGSSGKRVIIRKIQSEEEKAYNGVVPPIPEGYEKVGFGYPKAGQNYIRPKYYDVAKASVNYSMYKSIILRKKTKRYAVAKVELPEGAEILNPHFIFLAVKGLHQEYKPFTWEIVVE